MSASKWKSLIGLLSLLHLLSSCTGDRLRSQLQGRPGADASKLD